MCCRRGQLGDQLGSAARWIAAVSAWAASAVAWALGAGALGRLRRGQLLGLRLGRLALQHAGDDGGGRGLLQHLGAQVAHDGHAARRGR